MTYDHALVVGKFYPPHAGHHLLIREAAYAARQVTVVAMSSAAETIPLPDRIGWLRAVHAPEPNVTVTGIVCDAPLDFESRTVWAAQVACMRAVCPQPVDAVFSGEKYGDELARWFGAVHVRIDPSRVRVPVSGTAIRADLAGNWDALEPVVRAGLATRVIVVGAESTGTTTVSRALAERFRARPGVWARTQWVPEYGRQATLDKHAASSEIVWTGADFAAIAARQNDLEHAAATIGSPLLVCDTDAFATTVWERRHLGVGSGHAWTDLAPRAVYLLTDHVGVPFVPDGIRDGEHIRATMTGWFVDALTAARHSWVLLTGTLDERVDLAVRVADQALRVRMRFGDPPQAE